MSHFIPELKRELCINCEEIKIVYTEIVLELSEFSRALRYLKQGCICKECYFYNIREYRIYQTK
jgi:RNase P subunit RPR2